MSKIRLQNESTDPAAPGSGTVLLYPVDDSVRVQNSAGEVKTLLALDAEGYVYLSGDADTDGSARILTISSGVTLQQRVSGVWTDLVTWAAS